MFEHTPNLLGDRGKEIAYYALAELNNGGFALHIMTKEEIVKHGKHYSRSYSSKSSPWQTDFDAMAYKTVIRQLCDKKLPKATTEHSILLQEASRVDDIPDDLSVFHDIEEVSADIVEKVKDKTPPDISKAKEIIVDPEEKIKEMVNEVTGEVREKPVQDKKPEQTAILEG